MSMVALMIPNKYKCLILNLVWYLINTNTNMKLRNWLWVLVAFYYRKVRALEKKLNTFSWF